MATRVRRLAVGVVALAAFGGGVAGAQTAQTAPAAPTATFAIPSSAPAQQPMWARSITPCPVPTAGVASVVVVRIIDEVLGTELSASATEVRSDGAWDATVVAPPGPLGDGTIGYLVEAQCVTRDRTPTAETIVRQKYVLQPLDVTSGTAGASLGWIDGPVGGVATTTTTSTTSTSTPQTTSSSTTPTSLATGATSQAVSTQSAPSVQPKSSLSGTSTEEIQAELLAQAAIDEVRRTTEPADYVTLNASPASAGRDQAADGGIPPWAFVCAAMLAVGSVVAYGNRRPTPVEASTPGE